MDIWFRQVFTLGLAVGVAIGTSADELVIESFDRSGQLTFRTTPSATDYRVEWASTPNGPWSNSWSGLEGMEVHPRQQQVTCAVPMYYRVVATVTPTNPPPPEGMVLIPAGSFSMGNALSATGEGWTDELPPHTVYVNAFYMDRFEVTKALWDEVYTWAVGNGYSFDNTGSVKAANHPVQIVNWYDCVKWCNARSQKEDRTPCYTVVGNVYKTGQSTPDCNWSVAGYRLPTEAEWEKAARGGLSGQRFPWGANINHDYANYVANGSAYTYDTSPSNWWTPHPDYDDGEYPHTSPVGSFAANGYGLYDMAGNVWEWCWDWFGSSYYVSSPGSDPRGPSSGPNHVKRGGSWADYLGAVVCRVAVRLNDSNPGFADDRCGFRAVLPPGQ